jgi:hypothetical protein
MLCGKFLENIRMQDDLTMEETVAGYGNPERAEVAEDLM